VTTALRRRIARICIIVSAVLLLAIAVHAAASHSLLEALGPCGWPCASIIGAAGYLRSTRSRP
jgi:hypothetical protein